jgi:hypothetical protein
MFASNDFDKPTKPQMNPRIAGAIALAIGLGLGYWQIWLPLEAARHHAPSVSYESRAQFMAIFLVPMGLLMIALGDKINWQGDNGKLTRDWRYWILVLLGVGLAIGVDQWMKAEFAKYGYDMHSR